MRIFLYTFRCTIHAEKGNSEGVGIWFLRVCFQACAPTVTLLGFVVCLGRTPNLPLWLRSFVILLDVILFISALPESSPGKRPHKLREALYDELRSFFWMDGGGSR
ncbi:uncharacterized protein BDZ99DRAFT_466199 [Mytilinidion resinicola]|uniref:Uncharacterized protein n=1 Tax=Mytilinidion resinicola TaxID=574789 RepID=A0A6A6YAX1_9PEZI|nr:uncharacterized protein BDZ99DRAFT_466199 [Mytilinidion resinicola]KAF2805850.1 hypothetical protein BDZ99DRAFT_466199 [Mytilinidion resinicola]